MMQQTWSWTALLALALIAGCANSEVPDETAPPNNAPNNAPNNTPNNQPDGLSVISVAPDTGSPNGGTTIVVSGSGFVEGATVTIGDKPGIEVVFLSTFQLRVDTPPADIPGRVAVTVANPNGESATLDSAFEYLTPLEASVDWCVLQFPAALSAEPGATTAAIFGRVYEDGCTNGATTCGAIQGELGYGTVGADPSVDPSAFSWATATLNVDHVEDDNDEYSATLNVANAGTFSYAYRFSIDGGDSWTYCDLDGADNGFSTDQMGTLTVAEDVVSIAWCALQFPTAVEIAPGTESAPIFGRVFAAGCTEGDAHCAEVKGELGFGNPEVDASMSPEAFTWSPADHNADHIDGDNDEYSATLTVNEAGTYGYAYRFSIDNGENWTYCDLDGTDNGFQAGLMGTLSVEEDTISVGWCTIQFPTAMEALPNEASESVFGRVFAEGCTEGEAQCPEIQAELGYGIQGADPSLSPDDFDWVSATYNADHIEDDNDEYGAPIPGLDEGTYGYAFRFSANEGESWTYCDIDGLDNGFATDQMGVLTVGTPPEGAEVDWCNIQFPSATTTVSGLASQPIFGQVFSEGCTNGNARCEALVSELGLGEAGADPSANPEDFTWSPTTYNEDHTDDDNDEYSATLTVNEAGTYGYAFRVSGDGGESWTYCDLDGLDNGFSTDQMGTLTVTEGIDIGWCNIQFPGELAAAPGAATDLIFGRVFSEGCTEGDSFCGGLTAQVGYGEQGDDPSVTPEGFAWTAATYNAGHTSDNNDEHSASLTVNEAGVYGYAFRVSGDGGESWTYCDLDGLDNGFSTEQMGTLTISE